MCVSWDWLARNFLESNLFFFFISFSFSLFLFLDDVCNHDFTFHGTKKKRRKIVVDLFATLSSSSFFCIVSKNFSRKIRILFASKGWKMKKDNNKFGRNYVYNANVILGGETFERR